MKIKPLDIIVIAILFAVPIYFALKSDSGGEKHLYLIHDGIKKELKFQNSIINLEETTGHKITIEIKDSKARILESDCPNKICIKTGWIDSCGQSAVCVPNKTAVSIECKESLFDAESK